MLTHEEVTRIRPVKQEEITVSARVRPKTMTPAYALLYWESKKRAVNSLNGLIAPNIKPDASKNGQRSTGRDGEI
ncbi:MAG: hypothetical protein B5M55_04310 [Desulfococcus sp. 4484_242]|nr:MAG: hypothetical protein B5M55_04310 [Desulfococcus sp. 4484_242]